METVAPISVAEYHRMIGEGTLTELDRVELIDGRIVPKMPQYAGHNFAILELRNRLLRMADPSWTVKTESPITLSESEPEPDISVSRIDPPEAIRSRHPDYRECALVVEVADSTLSFDRTDKLAMYARDSIPICWIVNIPERTVEVYEVPNGTREVPVYKTRRVYVEGESVPLFLAGQKHGEIAVADVLP